MTQPAASSHAVIVMYDAPAELDAWMHGDHYREVLATPGVTGVRRYEVLDGPQACRKYLAVIETDDLDATLAWRQRSRRALAAGRQPARRRQPPRPDLPAHLLRCPRCAQPT